MTLNARRAFNVAMKKCRRGSDLDWLRAVISFGRHDAGRIIAGRHVDGRVENGTLGVLKVAERVARSLVANCVVWSQLVDVTAEEPPAAVKEAEKRWGKGSEVGPHSRVQQRVLQAVHESNPPLEAVQITGP